MARWWSFPSFIFDERDTAETQITESNDVNHCPAEFPWPHHETVHGHILPAWDDPPVLCQWLLHEAQHRLWAGPSLQRREGALSHYSTIFDQCVGESQKTIFEIFRQGEFSYLLYLPWAIVWKDIKSLHTYINASVFKVFVVCCDTPAIQYRLNFSSENWCLILVEQARLQPSASVLWWLCYFTGRGTRKSAPCSPFEGSCHASSVYSARHCVVLDRSLSLESPHTHSLFHECLSYLFKDTLLKSFFPLPRVI